MYSSFQELQDQSGTYTNNAVTVTTTESSGGAVCIGPMSRDVWEVAAGYNQGSAVTLYNTTALTKTKMCIRDRDKSITLKYIPTYPSVTITEVT